MIEDINIGLRIELAESELILRLCKRLEVEGTTGTEGLGDSVKTRGLRGDDSRVLFDGFEVNYLGEIGQVRDVGRELVLERRLLKRVCALKQAVGWRQFVLDELVTGYP